MQCGILDLILKQKTTLVDRLMKSEQSWKFSEQTVPMLIS